MDGIDVHIAELFLLERGFDGNFIKMGFSVTVENKGDCDKLIKSIHFTESRKNETFHYPGNLVEGFVSSVNSRGKAVNSFELPKDRVDAFRTLTDSDEVFVSAVAVMTDGTSYESNRINAASLWR
jgi:hypothetical protein